MTNVISKRSAIIFWRIFVSFGLLILVWQLAVSLGNFNKALFPSPYDSLLALWEITLDGTLISHIATSMARFAVGFISAVLLGVLLGLILGWFKNVFKYVNPIVQLLRPISPLAWLPFIVLWFGIGDIPATIIIFIAAFFPVLLSTVSAVFHIDPIYLKVASNFGVKQPTLMWKIIFPAVFPQIASGVHLALGTAWVFLVCGEMAGPQSGLGFLIIDARNDLRADILLADIVVIGLIGLFLDALLKAIENAFLKHWGN